MITHSWTNRPEGPEGQRVDDGPAKGVDCVSLAALFRSVELTPTPRQQDATEETTMNKAPILLMALGFVVVTFAQLALAQKPVNVTGNWDVTVRMPNGNVTEKWTVRQVGNKLTGTVKSAGSELPVTGERVSGVFLRASFKEGEVEHLIRATAEKDSMDGSITIGRSEYLWSAKRSQ